MNIALIQLDIEWENIEANLQILNEALDELSPNIELVILPEMFSTGFTMNPEKNAESLDGKALQWMKNTCEKRQIAICGSVCTSEFGLYYNRFYFVSPKNEIIAYDKRHLFSLANEQKHYTAGNTRKIISLGEWKILPQICYDLRFPVFSRNEITSPYDLAIYVANWPQQRVEAWKTLLPARAIENQCFVIGVNRIGSDPNGNNYTSQSACYSPLGQLILAEKNINRKRFDIIELQLNHREVYETRRKFKFLQDSDTFTIHDIQHFNC